MSGEKSGVCAKSLHHGPVKGIKVGGWLRKGGPAVVREIADGIAAALESSIAMGASGEDPFFIVGHYPGGPPLEVGGREESP